LERTILSTDDEEIAQMGRDLGIEVPFMRPKSLAGDDSPTRAVQRHALEWLRAEEGIFPYAMVTLQPTSPLRLPSHISDAVREFWDRGVDSVIGVTPVREHPYEVVAFDGERMFRPVERPAWITRRQQYPPFYYVNGAIYVTRSSVILEQDSGYGDRVYGYEMDQVASVDIDTPFDLHLAECLMKLPTTK